MNKNIKLSLTVVEVRKACRHFAMLYFHFCNNLVKELGEEKAYHIVQKTLFEMAIDRSDQLKVIAKNKNLELTMENFPLVNDLPRSGWVKELGREQCPYAETWFFYVKKYIWFKKFAELYCWVVDTTNCENFTGNTSYKMTQCVFWGDSGCSHVYIKSDDVKNGKYKYGTK